MKKGVKKILVLISVFGLLTGCGERTGVSPAQETEQETSFQDKLEWKEVRPGLSYATLSIVADNPKESKNLILASINPKKYDFDIYQNTEKETARTISEIHGDTNSLLTFNGNFFTEDFKSTGLLLSKGKILRDYVKAKLLNGIFAIRNDGTAEIITNGRINKSDYSFAIQSGPLLINKKGGIAVEDKSTDLASRTAIGIDEEGNITLIILKQSLLDMDNRVTLFQFAGLLKETPALQELNLHSVLNLDGGSSSGLMIQDRYYPEMEKVQNMIIVKERKDA